MICRIEYLFLNSELSVKKVLLTIDWFSLCRREAGAKGGLPAVGLKLNTLVQRLQVSSSHFYKILSSLHPKSSCSIAVSSALVKLHLCYFCHYSSRSNCFQFFYDYKTLDGIGWSASTHKFQETVLLYHLPCKPYSRSFTEASCVIGRLGRGKNQSAIWSQWVIDLVMVLEAILTSRQAHEKLHCLYENLVSNNFRKMHVLKKVWMLN